MPVTVDLRGIRFGYGAAPILDGIDLELGEGEFVVLAGFNGSGKSTLLRMCVGLLRPEAGEITVLGGGPGDAGVRRRIGYAPQGLRMATALPISVTEVVAAGLAASKGMLQRMDRKDWHRVTTAIESVGLGDLSAECLFELSGGQQQRAILARALVGDPDLLLLDEPTTGVDRMFRPALAAELRRRADQGTTVIAVSHDPDDFHEVADSVVVLEDGRVVSMSHEEYHRHLEARRP